MNAGGEGEEQQLGAQGDSYCTRCLTLKINANRDNGDAAANITGTCSSGRLFQNSGKLFDVAVPSKEKRRLRVLSFISANF